MIIGNLLQTWCPSTICHPGLQQQATQGSLQISSPSMPPWVRARRANSGHGASNFWRTALHCATRKWWRLTVLIVGSYRTRFGSFWTFWTFYSTPLQESNSPQQVCAVALKQILQHSSGGEASSASTRSHQLQQQHPISFAPLAHCLAFVQRLGCIHWRWILVRVPWQFCRRNRDLTEGTIVHMPWPTHAGAFNRSTNTH